MSLGLGLGLTKTANAGNLSNINSNAFLEYRGDKSASYSGSGTVWNSLIGDGVRDMDIVGSPTFSTNEFTMNDSSYFTFEQTPAATPSEMKNLHKTTGGQPYTLYIEFELPDFVQTQTLFANAIFSGGDSGFEIRAEISTGLLRYVHSAAGSFTVVTIGSILTAAIAIVTGKHSISK